LTGKIGSREAKFFSVSDHAGQTGEELKCEFSISVEDFWRYKLDPVMDPKQKHASAFEAFFLLHFETEANLLQFLNLIF